MRRGLLLFATLLATGSLRLALPGGGLPDLARVGLGAIDAAAQPSAGAAPVAPLTTPAVRRKVMELASAGRWQEAVGELDALARTDPADPGLAFLRGRALAQVGRHEEAVLALEGAVWVRRDFREAQRLLDGERRERARQDAVIRRLGDAVAANPHDVSVRVRRGERLLDLDVPDLALGEAEEILRAVPGEPGGLGLRGRALLALGRAADARPALEAAARARPRDYAVGRAHVRCLAQLGREDEARRAWDAVTREQPDTVPGLLQLARDLFERKQFLPAVATLKQAIDLDPANPVLHYHHGWYHREAAENAKGPRPGPIRASDQSLERAERLAGPDRRLRALIAWHRGQVEMAVGRALAAESLVKAGGNFPRALEHFERAVALDPYMYRAILDRGIARIALEQPDRARPDIQIFLRANPDNAGIVERRLAWWAEFHATWRGARDLARQEYERFSRWWEWHQANGCSSWSNCCGAFLCRGEECPGRPGCS